MVTKWDTGDIIFMPMQVRGIEIIGDRIFYKIIGGNDVDGNDVLIPEDKVVCGIHVSTYE